MTPDTDTSINEPLSLQEIAAVMVRHFGYRDGLYEIAIEVQIAVGKVGPRPGNLLPGAAVGVSRIGLARVEKMGPYTVDASKVSQGEARQPRKAIAASRSRSAGKRAQPA